MFHQPHVPLRTGAARLPAKPASPDLDRATREWQSRFHSAVLNQLLETEHHEERSHLEELAAKQALAQRD
jgi:hypothetical protein